MNVRAIPGRVRLRTSMLRNPQSAWPLRQELNALPGVQEVEVNIRVGSLLVCYDPDEISQARILDMLDERVPGGVQLPKARKIGAGPLPMTMEEKRVLYYTMLSALGTSLASLLISKKVHFITGLLFLSGLSLHLTDKRKILLP